MGLDTSINRNDVTTILNLSGGLDSVYAFWKYITTHKNPLLVHHVVLKSKERRWEYETRAVNAVLDWMNTHGYTNYEYIETVFDYVQTDTMVLDDQIVAFFTGIILKSNKWKNLKYTLMNAPKDEYVRLGTRLDRMRAKSKKVLESITNKELIPLYNLREKWKWEIVEEIPKSLRVLSWSCRRPTKDGDVCRSCHTCKQLAKKRPQEV